MKLSALSFRCLALVLALVMAATSLPAGPARAAFVGTEASLAAGDLRAQLLEVLARDEVRQELRRLGLAPEEAAARVAALSEAEIAALGARLQELPAGQGSSDARAVIALAIIFGAPVVIAVGLVVGVVIWFVLDSIFGRGLKVIT